MATVDKHAQESNFPDYPKHSLAHDVRKQAAEGRGYEKGYDCHLGFFDFHHKNPPAPFNPDFNPEYAGRVKEYFRRVHELVKDASFDHLSCEEYDQMFNGKALAWKQELRVFGFQLPDGGSHAR